MDLSPAYILHRRPYSNTSLLLDIFSLENGRFSAISRGGRSAKSQGNCLQPFIPLHILCKGRGEVKTLVKYEASGQSLLKHGELLYCGIYLNELMTRLLSQHEAYPDLFAYYSYTLEQLSKEESDKDIVLRYFELQLLQEIGYPVNLDMDIKGDFIANNKLYDYVPEYGLTISSAVNTGISGNSLNALNARTLTDQQQRLDAKRLMRYVLSFYLGDKPLMSRQLFMPLIKQD